MLDIRAVVEKRKEEKAIDKRRKGRKGVCTHILYMSTVTVCVYCTGVCAHATSKCAT